jgi:hypothetical protein
MEMGENSELFHGSFKEIDRVIGFIIVLTKLLITFLQHITDA